MGSFVLGVRVVLAGVFAVAGAAKLLDQSGSRRSLAEFGVPDRAVPVAAILLPLAELATAIALIFSGSARWGALAALLLLLGFIGGIVHAMRRGREPDCHCFGQLHSGPAGHRALARNAVLAGLAAVVLAEGPGSSVGDWVSARSSAELVAVAAVAVAVALGAVAVRLWSERRTLRAELADSRAKAATLPAGLPVGATAPGFALPDLNGQIHTLMPYAPSAGPLPWSSSPRIVGHVRRCSPSSVVGKQHWPTVSRWS